MNRYTQTGILSDARQGKRVVVIEHLHAESRAAFGDMAATVTDASAIYRANGQERIDFPSGGSVSFLAANSGLRGVIADVVCVSGWNDMPETQRQTIAPMVAKRGGELVRF